MPARLVPRAACRLATDGPVEPTDATARILSTDRGMCVLVVVALCPYTPSATDRRLLRILLNSDKGVDCGTARKGVDPPWDRHWLDGVSYRP